MEEGGGGGLPRVSSQMDARTHALGGAAAGSSMWAEEEKEQRMEGCQERRLASGVKTFLGFLFSRGAMFFPQCKEVVRVTRVQPQEKT